MLRTDLPKIITETVPGPKSQALIDRRKALTIKSFGNEKGARKPIIHAACRRQNMGVTAAGSPILK